MPRFTAEIRRIPLCSAMLSMYHDCVQSLNYAVCGMRVGFFVGFSERKTPVIRYRRFPERYKNEKLQHNKPEYIITKSPFHFWAFLNNSLTNCECCAYAIECTAVASPGQNHGVVIFL